MRKLLALSLILIVCLGMVVLPVFADIENKTVDDWDETYVAWTEAGTDPYLNTDDTDTSYISSATANALEGYFTFADTTFTTITDVHLWMKARFVTATSDNYVEIYNSSSVQVGSLAPITTSYALYDATYGTKLDYLDTPAEVNAFACYLKFIRIASSTRVIRVTYAYLNITGTTGETQNLSFEIVDTSKNLDTVSKSKTQTFVTVTTSKNLETMTTSKTQQFQIITTSKSIDVATRKITITIQITSTSKNTDAMTKTSTTPSAQPPPSSIGIPQLSVVFETVKDGKPLPDVEIRLFENIYNSPTATVVTDQLGTAMAWLYPGEFRFKAVALNGVEKNGTFLHMSFQTVKIDFSGLVPKGGGLSQTARIVVGFVVMGVFGVAIYQVAFKKKRR
jgi:hypothetical protein